jgi:hypothetical protein
MPPQEAIATLHKELKKLESALEGCTDSRIRVVIETRIDECQAKLVDREQLQR